MLLQHPHVYGQHKGRTDEPHGKLFSPPITDRKPAVFVFIFPPAVVSLQVYNFREGVAKCYIMTFSLLTEKGHVDLLYPIRLSAALAI